MVGNEALISLQVRSHLGRRDALAKIGPVHLEPCCEFRQDHARYRRPATGRSRTSLRGPFFPVTSTVYADNAGCPVPRRRIGPLTRVSQLSRRLFSCIAPRTVQNSCSCRNRESPAPRDCGRFMDRAAVGPDSNLGTRTGFGRCHPLRSDAISLPSDYAHNAEMCRRSLSLCQASIKYRSEAFQESGVPYSHLRSEEVPIFANGPSLHGMMVDQVQTVTSTCDHKDRADFRCLF